MKQKYWGKIPEQILKSLRLICHFCGYIMYHPLLRFVFFFFFNHFYSVSLRFYPIAAYLPLTGIGHYPFKRILFKNSTQVLLRMTNPKPKGWNRKRCPSVTNMRYLNIINDLGWMQNFNQIPTDFYRTHPIYP